MKEKALANFFIFVAIYAVAYIAEDKLIERAEKYIVSIDANFDEFYESIELRDGFSECRFYEVYRIYHYKTCLRPYDSTLGEQNFRYEYWRPNRILWPKVDDSYHSKEPYAKRTLITTVDVKSRYQKYDWKEAPDE